MKYGKLLTFLGGVLMGTAGVAVLSGQDAKKAYTHATAAVLRGKDSIMKTATTVKENCGDIYADAKDINDDRYEKAKEAEIARAKAIVEQAETEENSDCTEVNE